MLENYGLVTQGNLCTHREGLAKSILNKKGKVCWGNLASFITVKGFICSHDTYNLGLSFQWFVNPKGYGDT